MSVEALKIPAMESKEKLAAAAIKLKEDENLRERLANNPNEVLKELGVTVDDSTVDAIKHYIEKSKIETPQAGLVHLDL
ncbi:hypothetical protein [Pseudoalteromonas spongiae]|uniref:hypothetical protein n=1 Tax=Pseudoalteromonas spongiae TaxID=298657 RepID=UPI00110A8EBE|nr:hypothetical protein [Pseudoalteromonas spongiae]TMO84325.1 hypothetical protein CWC15_12025 [Pseudoalteromonas spongiae]